jgi:hypothetical protein
MRAVILLFIVIVDPSALRSTPAPSPLACYQPWDTETTSDWHSIGATKRQRHPHIDVLAKGGMFMSGDITREPGPPYLFVDLYPGDLGPHGFYGAIIKAFEGTQYADRGWFADNWPTVHDAGGNRYGTSWFRGAYLPQIRP